MSVLWEFEEIGRGWFRFDPTATKAVEEAIAQGKHVAHSKFFNPRMMTSVDYEYKLDSMKQINLATGFTRNIRRTPPLPRAAGAAHAANAANVAPAAAAAPQPAAQGGGGGGAAGAAAGAGGGHPHGFQGYATPEILMAMMAGVPPELAMMMNGGLPPGFPAGGGVAVASDDDDDDDEDDDDEGDRVAHEVIRYDGPEAGEGTFEHVTKFTTPKDVGSGAECSVCLDGFTDDGDSVAIQLSKCSGHYFHRRCLDRPEMFKNGSIRCPNCSRDYGVRTGIQPRGTMVISGPESSVKCDGFNVGSYVIQYDFPNGLQAEGMPEPNRPYSGTMRVAFIPATEEGKTILSMHKVAFKRGLMFTVGTSLTTGRRNTVVWGSVHHKTMTTGGPVRHGFPDPDYFERVTEELKAVGITPDDV